MTKMMKLTILFKVVNIALVGMHGVGENVQKDTSVGVLQQQLVIWQLEEQLQLLERLFNGSKEVN